MFVANFSEQHVELMPRELRGELLGFGRELFAAARFAGLTLQRTDLAVRADDGREAGLKNDRGLYTKTPTNLKTANLKITLPESTLPENKST